MQLTVFPHHKTLNPKKSEILKQFFVKNAYPSAKQTKVIARRTDLKVNKVLDWFHCQRVKLKNSTMSGEKI